MEFSRRRPEVAAPIGKLASFGAPLDHSLRRALEPRL